MQKGCVVKKPTKSERKILMVTIIFMNLLFTLVIASTKSAFGVLKSFPYENHSKCYKKAGIKIVTLAIYTYLIYIMRLF